MRLWSAVPQPFLAPPDAGGGDEASAADAGDFVMESGSVADFGADHDDPAGGSERSASLPEANEPPEEPAPPAAPDAPAPRAAAAPAKKPNKVPLAARTADLKAEINKLTHEKHKTRAEADQAARDLAEIRAEITARQAQRPGAEPAVKAAPKADPDPMPEHPDYRKFETDEAYDEAVKTHRKDVAGWQTRRTEALKRELTETVDGRLQSRTAAETARRVDDTIVKTLDSVRQDRPDWQEKAHALKDLTSAWYDPKTMGRSPTPFLTDLASSLLSQGSTEGAELLDFLGSDVDRAQRIADLRPTRPLRDALETAPSVIPLLDHFATDDGAQEFEALKRMHPTRMFQALGMLYARLVPASRGSGPAVHHVTKAAPSYRPQVGSPGARRESGTRSEPDNFEGWMADEDTKEQAAREKLASLSR